MDGFAIVFLSKRGEGVMALSVQEAAPALQRGASGVEVQILQHRLNRIGALLDCDGDFGSVTEGAVKEAQQRAGLPATGIADAATWAWLEAQPEPSDSIPVRSEEHTSELQSLMRNSYAVFCLKKKK